MARSANQKLKDELLGKQTDMDQLGKIREDLALARAEVDKWKEALRIKDGDIDYLRSHVAQLTQSIGQLSLKPGEEEIKAKHWYQFWK